MKSNNFRRLFSGYLIVCLLAGLLLFPPQNRVSGAQITASEDIIVDGGGYVSDNMPTSGENLLWISTGLNYYSVIQFDLTGYSGVATDASLMITFYMNEYLEYPLNINVYRSINTPAGIESLSSFSAPDKTLITTVEVSPSDTNKTINVTNYINSEMSGDKIATLILEADNWQGFETVMIYSSEASISNYRPILNATLQASPEMSVEGNGVEIADGDTTPSASDHTDFGSADIDSGTVERTFTIRNKGNLDLTLTASPEVSIGGTHAADFSVDVQPTSPVTPSGSTTFKVTFNPSASGLRSATISIENNDPDENPYNFSIQGTGVKASSSTELSTSVNPSVYGQAVTFTVTVSASVGTPTGTVDFQDGGTTISGCGAKPLDGSGQATCTTSTLGVGTHTISAAYSGDANFSTSSGTLSPDQTVNKADTSTALSTSVNPSVAGQAVTFTATVSASAPGSGTPTGTVNFKDGGTTISGCGAKPLDGSGQATCSTAGLSAGSHTITALYSGSDLFYTSSATLSPNQSVDLLETTTSVTSSLNPADYGQTVTFSATVSAASGSPTGTVNFRSDGTTISGCGVSTLVAGQATCITASLAGGTHTITAVYSGDSNFATSTGTLTPDQVINKHETTSTLTVAFNPLAPGNILTLVVTSSGSEIPTGTATFKDNGSDLPGCVAVPVVNGTATCTTVGVAAGVHQYSAVYSGDEAQGGSTSSAINIQSISLPLILRED